MDRPAELIEPYLHLIADGETTYPPVRRKPTKAERIEVYAKCDGHCAYCGGEITISQMQVDHLWPISLGGIDTMINWNPSCRSCNHYKSSSPPYSFREMLEDMPRVLMRDSVTYKNAVRFGLVVPNPKSVVFYFETLAALAEKG